MRLWPDRCAIVVRSLHNHGHDRFELMAHDHRIHMQYSIQTHVRWVKGGGKSSGYCTYAILNLDVCFI